MKIIADSAIPFLRGVLEPFAEVEYLPGTAISAADVRNADALVIRTRTRCDEKLLADSRVKLIATATIGFDHIDTEYCRRHGIEVATAAGCNARGVLQYVAAALVRLSRVQAWEPADKTLGIVGVGHVGSLVEAYARTWGFRVVACDPPREEREHGGFARLERAEPLRVVRGAEVPERCDGVHRRQNRDAKPAAAARAPADGRACGQTQMRQQRERERTNARANLEHALIARELGKLANALNYMVVDQEVLAQAMLGRKAKLLQQLPCCRGVCQRRSCHSCLLSMMAAS